MRDDLIDLTRAVQIGWHAFWDLRRWRQGAECQTRQERRIRSMSDAELLLCARQWGGHVVRPELRRRGIDLPGGPTSA